jgi:hypothetical protein
MKILETSVFPLIPLPSPLSHNKRTKNKEQTHNKGTKTMSSCLPPLVTIKVTASIPLTTAYGFEGVTDEEFALYQANTRALFEKAGLHYDGIVDRGTDTEQEIWSTKGTDIENIRNRKEHAAFEHYLDHLSTAIPVLTMDFCFSVPSSEELEEKAGDLANMVHYTIFDS